MSLKTSLLLYESKSCKCWDQCFTVWIAAKSSRNLIQKHMKAQACIALRRSTDCTLSLILFHTNTVLTTSYIHNQRVAKGAHGCVTTRNLNKYVTKIHSQCTVCHLFLSAMNKTSGRILNASLHIKNAEGSSNRFLMSVIGSRSHVSEHSLDSSY